MVFYVNNGYERMFFHFSIEIAHMLELFETTIKNWLTLSMKIPISQVSSIILSWHCEGIGLGIEQKAHFDTVLSLHTVLCEQIVGGVDIVHLQLIVLPN